MENTINTIYLYLTTYGLSIIAAVVIFVVGRWLAKVISKLVATMMTKAKVDTSLVSFMQGLSYIALLVFVVIAALAKLGIETASFIVVLGAAGLAIGLALQGSLANFASGVLILIFKPFKIGDFVELAGTTGTVKQIQIFNTTLNSPDNLRIIIPNAKVTGDKIINYTANGTRRVDLSVGVSYDDDLENAKHIIEDILSGDGRILKDPAPTVAVSELADSSVNFVVRPWVKCEDYWSIYFDMTSKIKLALDNNHITIPYPQIDIHVKNENKKDVEMLQRGRATSH